MRVIPFDTLVMGEEARVTANVVAEVGATEIDSADLAYAQITGVWVNGPSPASTSTKKNHSGISKEENMEITINAKCSKCGSALDIEFNSTGRYDGSIIADVEPCEECVRGERAEADAEGYARGAETEAAKHE